MVRFSIKHPWIIISSIVILFILGFSGFSKMTPELFPKMELPYVLIITPYPGANPETVETQVTDPLEKSFASLENLQDTQSTSSNNASLIFLSFAENSNVDSLTVDILEKVKQTSGTFPDMAQEPMILKLSPDMMPSYIAAAKYKGKDRKSFSKLVDEEILNDLKGINGVATVNASGQVEDQINVVLDEAKIKSINNNARSLAVDEINENIDKLNSAKNEINLNLKNLTKIKNLLTKGIDKLLKETKKGSDEISKNLNQINDLYVQLEVGLSALSSSINTLETLSAGLNQIFAPMQLDFSTATDAMKSQIKNLTKQKEKLLKAREQLSKALRDLDHTKITNVTKMTNSLTDVKIGILKLEGALEKMDSGLTEIDTAKESVLKGIDLENVITADTIVSLLKAQNFSMPAGSIYDSNLSYLVRVDNAITNLDSLENMTLIDLGIKGLPQIKLKDVSTVFMSDNLDSIYAKINGADGIVFTFMKQSLSGTTEVVNSIKERISSLEKKYPDLTFIPINDTAEMIYTIVYSILQSLLFATLFTIVVLLFFLRSFRPTLITVLSIPISFVFAIILMYFTGVTINILSLSALAIATGMLVDNSIVVIENVFRLKHKGLTSLQAAVEGAKELMPALVSSTLTTIAVFFPIVFVTGITRQLFQDFALTLSYALVASFIMAFTLVPILSSRLFHGMKEKKHRVWDRIAKSYKKNLSFFLEHKASTLIAVLILFVGSGVLVGVKGFSFMPSMTTSRMLHFNVSIDDDEPYSKLVKDTDATYEKIKDIKNIKHIGILSGGGEGSELSLIGIDSLSQASDSRSIKSNSVYIVLGDMNKAGEVRENIESKLTNSGIDFKFAEISMGSAMTSNEVTLNFFGKNLDDLISEADSFIKKIEGTKNIKEVTSDISELKKEITLKLDREKVAEYGLTIAEVYQLISAKITESKTADDITIKNKNYNVIIDTPFKEEINIDYLKNLKFKNPKASDASNPSAERKEIIKLSDISTISFTNTLPSVPHQNERRTISVSISYDTEKTNPTKVQNYAERLLKDSNLNEDDVTYEFSGSAEDTMNSVRDMFYMLLLGILIVYLIMVAQFGSLKNPFIIMVTIPLACTGGLIALLITFSEISVIALIGFVMCVGIIVNNGIVLVDAINRLRMKGMTKINAIKTAGEMRLRPIIMTTATTVLGMLVMAIGIGSGTAIVRPLAIVCIGGLTYATLMTLFVVPIIYDIFNKKNIKVVKDDDLEIDKKLKEKISEI